MMKKFGHAQNRIWKQWRVRCKQPKPNYFPKSLSIRIEIGCVFPKCTQYLMNRPESPIMNFKNKQMIDEKFWRQKWFWTCHFLAIHEGTSFECALILLKFDLNVEAKSTTEFENKSALAALRRKWKTFWKRLSVAKSNRKCAFTLTTLN